MRELRLILGDQLNVNHSWFKKTDPNVTYLMMEVRSEASYVTHHIQKIVAFFVAMRAFSEELRALGHRVIYLEIDSANNRQCLAGNIEAIISADAKFCSFAYQLPDEFRVDQILQKVSSSLKIPVSFVDTEHFFTTREELAQLFREKKSRVMESFYRSMRVKHEILMNGDKPEGERWNFDSENRNRFDERAALPPSLKFSNHEQVRKVLSQVTSLGIKTLGDCDPTTFRWPTTREQALQVIEHFTTHSLAHFGKYQDAMSSRHPILFHSLLSFPLNVKLISPAEVIDAAIKTYRESKGRIRLPQVEGFVRQILGWREYMRGMYWEQMPKYKSQNYLNAKRSLPHFFWDGDTKMNCLRHAIGQSLSLAYAHHIQRLMITGSFALLAGIDPDQVDAWYLGIYIDAIEWVELMNTRGMSQFADGGIVATKPYCSTANYIKKMSDYCADCHYNSGERIGGNSCPLNALYWDFHIRNRSKLERNPRIGMVFRSIDRMSTSEVRDIKKQSLMIVNGIESL